MYDIGLWLFAQVFNVNNVNVVIRTRTEHLTDEEKARIKSRRKRFFICYFVHIYISHGINSSLFLQMNNNLLFKGERNVLESLLGTVEQHISAQGVRCTFSNYIKIMLFVPIRQLI